ncbi:transaldolase family protein [Alteribacillus sp. YIM 98480]|uniref:transaldolase family protein n=1 Tax=Alteribacillus sp. YIM 98480 TaxID=2606599 RepID=UPI00131B71F6|nr:transaldolase family protein [Alteribacillus sp. YIM 98480]
MKILIDSANIKKINRLNEIYYVHGITTNPSILAKEETYPEKSLSQINKVIDEKMEFHIQVLAETAEDMVKEANHILNTYGRAVYIKVPVSEEGFKAIKWLAKDGVKTTATAVFSVQQGILAALAGAHYIAPYVNRIDNFNGDGIELIQRLSELFEKKQIKTKILAASFKNTKQIEDALLAGAHTVTVPPDLLDKMGSHKGTDEGIKGFIHDYEAAFK